MSSVFWFRFQFIYSFLKFHSFFFFYILFCFLFLFLLFQSTNFQQTPNKLMPNLQESFLGLSLIHASKILLFPNEVAQSVKNHVLWIICYQISPSPSLEIKKNLTKLKISMLLLEHRKLVFLPIILTKTNLWTY